MLMVAESFGKKIQPSEVLIALIIYVQTLFFVEYSLQVLLLILLAGISLFRNSLVVKFHSSQVILLLAYSFLAILYYLNNDSYNLSASNPIVGMFILAVVIVASNTLGKNVVVILVYLLFFESLIIIGEFFSNSPYIFSAQLGGKENLRHSTDMGLYGMKVLGLGSSSTQFSAKAVFILLAAKSINFKPRLVVLLFILIGALFTFSRSGMIGVILVSLSLVIPCSKRGAISLVGLLVLSTIMAIPIIFINIDLLIYVFENNFLKGKELGVVLEDPASVLTGRAYLWQKGLEFWLQNLLFGNLGVAWEVLYLGEMYHVHNSFLYILVKGGILLLLPYVWIMSIVLKRVGAIAFLGFFFYLFFGSSLGSYGSFNELLLFYIIIKISYLNLDNHLYKNYKSIAWD